MGSLPVFVINCGLGNFKCPFKIIMGVVSRGCFMSDITIPDLSIYYGAAWLEVGLYCWCNGLARTIEYSLWVLHIIGVVYGLFYDIIL